MSRSLDPNDLISSERRSRGRLECMRVMCVSTWSMIRVECTETRRKGVARKVRGLLRLVKNFPGFLGLFRVMTHPHVIDLTHRHPSLLSKSLRSDYLARSLETCDRLCIQSNHYEYLKRHVRKDFLRGLYSEGYELWSERLQGFLLEIHLDFPKEHDYEGDLRLVFKCECTVLYSVTFTIVPGCYVDVECEQALLISNVQGAAGRVELMRQATKICHDTAPVHLLLSAAQALAILLGIKRIAGIGHEEQVSVALSKPDSAEVHFNYDRFWASYIGKASHGGFYVVPVPFPEKSLAMMRSRHRARGLRRRELRKRIFNFTVMSFKKACLEPR